MFLAVPWAVEMKMLDPRFKLHAQRVAARRAGIDPREARKAAAKKAGPSLKKPAREVDEDLDEVDEVEVEETPAAKKATKAMAGSAPRAGARPGGGGARGGSSTPRKRQSGKRR